MPPHSTMRSRSGGVASARVAGADAIASATRPVDPRVVPVAPGVVKIERVILEGAVLALRRGEPARIRMDDVLEPYDVFAAAARDAFDGDLGNAGDHQLALAAVHREIDLGRFAR